MFGLRWRAGSSLTLFVVFALCVSTQHGPIVAAKDKVKATVAAENDDASSSAATADEDEQPVKAKSKSTSTKKKTRPETAKKKKKSSGDDTGSSSSPATSGSGNRSGGGFLPGGQASGTTGASSVDNTNGKTAQSPQATGSPSTRPGATGSGSNTSTGKGNGGKGNAGGNAADQAAGADQGPNPELVRKVMDIQNRNHAAIAGQKGVVGTFTGLDEDGNVVIKVYTTGADNPQIPKAIEGVDVLEVLTGPIHKLQTTPGAPQRQQRLGRPVPIGITAFSDTDLSATSCAAGTLGCRLRDNHGNFYALSNNHVFAGVNGTQGKDPNGLPPEIPVAGPFQIPGTNIVQPAPGDDNCAIGNAPDIIGVLVAFVFIDTTSINFVDCAIAKTTPQLVNTSTLADGYGAPTSTTVLPFLGQKVQKYGRTSGYTTGTVTGINGIALIDFDGPKALFAREIEITGISPAFFPSYGVPGDSGSLVVDMNRNPVALLHAGGGGITLCNPIRLVLAFLADELMAHPGLPQDIVLTVDDAKPTQVSKEGRANPEPNNLP